MKQAVFTTVRPATLRFGEVLMAMRLILISALAACSGEPGEPFTREPAPTPLARFERLGTVADTAGGLVALDGGPGGWLGRNGGIERIDAVDGATLERIELEDPAEPRLLDHDGDRWLLAVDGGARLVDEGGGTVADHPVDGVLRAGRIGAGRTVYTVDHDGVCNHLAIEDDGTAQASLAADCMLGGDIEAWTGEQGPRIASDAGRAFALTPGQREVEVWQDGALADVFQVERTAMDLTARAGTLIVLSDDQVMTQLDPESGRALAEREVHRPEGVDRIRLSQDGTGIVLDGPEGAVFFALDMDARGFLLPDHPDFGTVPGTPGGNGLGGLSAPSPGTDGPQVI